MSQAIIFLIGRVGQNPEERQYQSGKTEVKLSLGVNRIRASDTTDWFNLSFYGKNADLAADTVRKGDLISINGTINIDQWTDL